MAFNYGVLLALGAMIGFGAYPVFSKNLVGKFGPYVTGFYVHLIAWILVLIALLPGFGFPMPKGWIIALIVLQGFTGASAIGLMFMAYNRTKVSLAVSLISTYPLLVLIASIFFFKEDLSLLKIIAALIIIAGAWIIVTDFFALTKGKNKGLWIIIAAMCLLALNVTLMKPIVANVGGAAASIYVETLTVAGLLGYVLVKRKRFVVPTKLRSFFLPGAFVGLAVACVFFAIAKLGVGLTAAIVGGGPFVATLAGWLYLKEKLDLRQIVGVIVVVFGIILISI